MADRGKGREGEGRRVVRNIVNGKIIRTVPYFRSAALLRVRNKHTCSWAVLYIEYGFTIEDSNGPCAKANTSNSSSF